MFLSWLYDWHSNLKGKKRTLKNLEDSNVTVIALAHLSVK